MWLVFFPISPVIMCFMINAMNMAILEKKIIFLFCLAASAQDSKCCDSHSQLGNCEPGIDDIPGGECWDYCIDGCRGGVCKKVGSGHLCHCYC